MIEEPFKVQVSGDESVSAVRVLPDALAAGWLFVYAPGAGSNIDDPFGMYACRELAARGYTSVRFQFPYMEAGRRRPDHARKLEAAWREVIETLRTTAPRIAVGGRSMGGRIASQVVAAGVQVDALCLLAYPLHRPGVSSERRDAHLPSIRVPTLFCSGTRDTFATPEEIREAAARVSAAAAVRILEGADHGFRVLKSSGRTREDVWGETVTHIADWLSTYRETRTTAEITEGAES